MTTLTWDASGQRFYETGVDQGVLYIPDAAGAYNNGVAWNGLTSVSESPTGAEPNALYADNIKYLNLYSAEEFGATIEAYTYPDEFAQYDGMFTPQSGVSIGQQSRKSFGLSYRTKVGNDVDGDNHGYKLHLIYGCTASPSEKAFSSINDSPEAITFSYEVSTVPVAVTGATPTSIVTIDSTKVGASNLLALETFLYGTPGTDPSLPLPDAVIALFAGSSTEVTPTEPAFNGTDTITIPTITGVVYYDNTAGGTVAPAGAYVIDEDTIIQARPASGYIFPANVDSDWLFIHA